MLLQGASHGLLSDKKILVVDDDPIFSKLLSAVAAREGAQLVIKHDGAEALDHLANHSCDVAIIDLIMPKVDGIRLISILRQMPDKKNIRIVVMTARRDENAIKDVSSYNVSLFLTKPVKWSKVPQQLYEVCQQSIS